MSGPDETMRMPPGSAWTTPAAFAEPVAQDPTPARHAYGLVVRDATLGAAAGLVARSLPYALAPLRRAADRLRRRGDSGWRSPSAARSGSGEHVATIFGWVWAIGGLVCAGFVWGTILRYALHMIECGHVAVLTELITRGTIGNGSESMFAYGRRIVTERFAQANVLFGLNALVRGVVQSFHRTLDWIAEMLPIPGLESLASLIDIVLKAATRYLDKVIFSYNLARGSSDPWTSSREGLVYYAQNAKPVLKTAMWCAVLERVLSVLLFVVLLVRGLITLALPHSVREVGGLVTVLVALLLAGPIPGGVHQALFLVMIMVRFPRRRRGPGDQPGVGRAPRLGLRNSSARWGRTPPPRWAGRAGGWGGPSP